MEYPLPVMMVMMMMMIAHLFQTVCCVGGRCAWAASLLPLEHAHVIVSTFRWKVISRFFTFIIYFLC